MGHAYKSLILFSSSSSSPALSSSPASPASPPPPPPSSRHLGDPQGSFVVAPQLFVQSAAELCGQVKVACEIRSRASCFDEGGLCGFIRVSPLEQRPAWAPYIICVETYYM